LPDSGEAGGGDGRESGGRGLGAQGGPVVAGVSAGQHRRGAQRFGGHRRRNVGERTARSGQQAAQEALACA
jgi:hypothetical protein